MRIANIPMLNADIVTGISLMLVFLVIGNFLSRFDRELPILASGLCTHRTHHL